MMTVKTVEYIWLDGAKPTGKIRSKTRLLSIPQVPKIDDFPEWSFDGSSTEQAYGGDSDCLLKPVNFVLDPLENGGDYLVLCEVLNPDGSIRIMYAGTLDEMDATPSSVPGIRQIWIVDKKTSKSVSHGHGMQLSSYSHADIDYKTLGITDEEWKNRKLAVLQLGYPYNKDKYKFYHHFI